MDATRNSILEIPHDVFDSLPMRVKRCSHKLHTLLTTKRTSGRMIRPTTIREKKGFQFNHISFD